MNIPKRSKQLIIAIVLMAAIQGFAVETKVAPFPDVPPSRAMHQGRHARATLPAKFRRKKKLEASFIRRRRRWECA